MKRAQNRRRLKPFCVIHEPQFNKTPWISRKMQTSCRARQNSNPLPTLRPLILCHSRRLSKVGHKQGGKVFASIDGCCNIQLSDLQPEFQHDISTAVHIIITPVMVSDFNLLLNNGRNPRLVKVCKRKWFSFLVVTSRGDAIAKIAFLASCWGEVDVFSQLMRFPLFANGRVRVREKEKEREREREFAM